MPSLGRVTAVVTVLTLAALVSACGKDQPPSQARSTADFKAALADAPAPLHRELYSRPSTLVDGGKPAFERTLAKLRGYPVVVNKWASWCAPCRTEFPIFQSESVAKGKRVAFLGLNAGDSRDPARRFLRASPLPFPSYVDPDEKIAKSIQAPANYPITVFFDARGREVYTHQGGYRKQADLAADLKRYLKQ